MSSGAIFILGVMIGMLISAAIVWTMMGALK